MKSYIYLAGLILLLASCSSIDDADKKAGRQANKAMVVTVNEKVGVKEVTDFYGGACNFTTGVTEQGNRRYARLEMSKSAALDQNTNITELNVSNIALTFYKDLADERKNFDEVQAAISFSNGKQAEKAYPASLLNMVLDKSDIVMKVVDALKDQKYDQLSDLLDDKNGILQFDKNKLMNKIRASDTAIGKIKSFVTYGFMIIKSESGKDILHISGMIMRDRKNNEFSVDINPSSPEKKAIFINYKL